MRILMVTPYPPARDGIASYAVQSVARLRAAGNDVEVLSPYASAAHHSADLRGWRGALALAQHVRGYDRVIIQFHPDMFFMVPHTPAQRARTAAALAFAFRSARDLEVRVHESDYTWGRGGGAAAMAVRAMWHAVPRLVVHTEAERERFSRAFGVPAERIHIAAHGADLVPRTDSDRSAARTRLGIPDEELMFLSIGFIQEHKGFDRAVRAFGTLGTVGGRGARLDIVGSVRVEDQAQLAYADQLERLVQATPGARLHAGFLSEEAFDLWIVACDVLVLPYRHIWSSGVMERAALFDRPVIATRVGGLADQARPGTVLVDDDRQLADAMRAAARDRGLFTRALAADAQWPAESLRDRAGVLAEVRARAALARGSSDGRGPVALPAAALAAPRRRSTELFRRTAPLRRMRLLGLPPPVSTRPGVTPLKRAVRRLTGWELNPVVEHLNELQRAVVEVVDWLSQEHDAAQQVSRGAQGPPPEPRKPQRRGSRRKEPPPVADE